MLISVETFILVPPLRCQSFKIHSPKSHIFSKKKGQPEWSNKSILDVVLSLQSLPQSIPIHSVTTPAAVSKAPHRVDDLGTPEALQVCCAVRQWAFHLVLSGFCLALPILLGTFEMHTHMHVHLWQCLSEIKDHSSVKMYWKHWKEWDPSKTKQQMAKILSSITHPNSKTYEQSLSKWKLAVLLIQTRKKKVTLSPQLKGCLCLSVSPCLGCSPACTRMNSEDSWPMRFTAVQL